MRLDFGEGRAIAPQRLRSGIQAWLDGPVREAAVVYVNDRRAGSVWCPPYSIDVTGFFTRGANALRILVGTLAINDMAGHPLPNYRVLNLRYGLRFEPQDMDSVQPVPAGLLGPIRLISADARCAALRTANAHQRKDREQACHQFLAFARYRFT